MHSVVPRICSVNSKYELIRAGPGPGAGQALNSRTPSRMWSRGRRRFHSLGCKRAGGCAVCTRACSLCGHMSCASGRRPGGRACRGPGLPEAARATRRSRNRTAAAVGRVPPLAGCRRPPRSVLRARKAPVRAAASEKKIEAPALRGVGRPALLRQRPRLRLACAHRRTRQDAARARVCKLRVRACRAGRARAGRTAGAGLVKLPSPSARAPGPGGPAVKTPAFVKMSLERGVSQTITKSIT